MKRLSGVLGFITNSSSAIYHFPGQLLEHPTIKKFMEIYEIQNGYIGRDLWNRGDCETLATTPAQKEEVAQRFQRDAEQFSFDVPSPGVNVNSDEVLLIYGDEYSGITSILCELMRNAAQELGLTYSSGEYN